MTKQKALEVIEAICEGMIADHTAFEYLDPNTLQVLKDIRKVAKEAQDDV